MVIYKKKTNLVYLYILKVDHINSSTFELLAQHAASLDKFLKQLLNALRDWIKTLLYTFLFMCTGTGAFVGWYYG